MPYVSREAGIVTGVMRWPSPDIPEEFLADEDAEVLAYRNRPEPPAPMTAEELFTMGKTKGLWADGDRPVRL